MAPTVYPFYSDLSLPFAVSGQTLTVGQAIMQAPTAYLPPTLYVGLIVANSWTASTVVTDGTYVTAGNPNVFATTNRRIYVCTSAGTTGTTEPTWVQFPPGSVTRDGTAQWTEASTRFGGTRNVYDTPTFTGAEPTDSAYARAVVTNSSIVVGDTVKAPPSAVWPTSTTSWGNIAGLFMSDAASGGNYWAWGLLPRLYQGVAGSGITPVLTLPTTLSTLAVNLVRRATTPFNTTLGTSQTVTLSNVVGGDTLVIAVSMWNSQEVSSVASTGSPTWTPINGVAGGGGGGSYYSLEWWYAPSVTAGSNVVTVTTTGPSYFGLWLGELANAGTPVSGMTAACPAIILKPTNIPWTAMTVLYPGSWVAVASNGQDGGYANEADFTSLGQFDVGPLNANVGANIQTSGLTYGTANVTVPAATGWYFPNGGQYVAAGIVVPPLLP